MHGLCRGTGSRLCLLTPLRPASQARRQNCGRWGSRSALHREMPALRHLTGRKGPCAQKTTGTSGVAPSETGMTPAGRTIFLHMGQVRSRASQVLMQASQKKWLHVSLMGVLIASCTPHTPHSLECHPSLPSLILPQGVLQVVRRDCVCARVPDNLLRSRTTIGNGVAGSPESNWQWHQPVLWIGAGPSHNTWQMGHVLPPSMS